MVQAWIIVSTLALITYLSLKIEPSKNFRLFLPSNLVAIYYLTSFGVGVAVYTSSSYTLENSTSFSIQKVGWIAIIGLVSLKLSSQIVVRILVRDIESKNRPLIGFFNSKLMFFLILLGWVCRIRLISVGRFFHTSSIDYSATTNRTSFLFSTLAILPLIVTFSIYLKSKSLNSRVPIKFYSLLCSEVVYYLISGSRQAFLSPIVGYLYLYSRYSKTKFRLPRGIKISLSSLLPLMFAYIGIYRTLMVERGFGIINSMKYSYRILFNSGFLNGLTVGINSIFQRSTDVISFSKAASLPKNSLSDVMHNPFLESIYALIPRLVLPDKQDISNISNILGHTLGMVNTNDTHTSVDFPHILEGYLFSSYFGVIVVCSMSGILYGLMDTLIVTANKQYIQCIFAAFALGIFNSPAQIIAHGLIGLIKSGSTIYLFLTLFQKFPTIKNRFRNQTNA